MLYLEIYMIAAINTSYFDDLYLNETARTKVANIEIAIKTN